MTCSALAHHGVLPYDGRHLSPWQISAAICHAYNLSPTLAVQLIVPFHALWQGVSHLLHGCLPDTRALLNVSCLALTPASQRGWVDLEDLGAQNLVEHDGSFTREDINSPFISKDQTWVITEQAKPSKRLINLCL